MNTMNRHTTLTMTTMAFLCLGSCLFGTYTVDETAKTYTVHIERCTFPQWDEGDGTNNIAMPTENELNITTTKPIQDPTMGAFVPHLNFKRAK